LRRCAGWQPRLAINPAKSAGAVNCLAMLFAITFKDLEGTKGAQVIVDIFSDSKASLKSFLLLRRRRSK
jgi:hypothetical protein